MSTYLLEFAILHLLFFGIYKALLSKETQLSFLRFFLIGSTVLSMIVPLLKIPTKSEIPTLNMDAIILPAVTTGDPTPSPQVQWYLALLVAVSVVLIVRLVHTLLQIAKWYRNSRRDAFEEWTIRRVPGLRNSFTFLQWIFIDPEHFENPGDIIRHEQGHVVKLHSIDILFFRVLTICFWWLPSIWLMIKELRAVHEFEADEYAIKINDTTYTKTLVHSTLKAHGMSLASSFDDAPIFNRLNFMKKMKKKISIWKLASIGTLVAISGAMFACEEELQSEINRIADESSQQVAYSDEVEATLNQLQLENPNEKYVVVETKFENRKSIEKLNSYDPSQIEHVFVNKDGDEKSVVMIIRQGSQLFEKTVEVQEQEGDVFTIVEEAASFPGGTEAWGRYLMENLTYPKAAVEKGIEGRVFVQFIVEKDGSLTSPQVVKGIGAGCDEEALRIIENSPNWIPGKQRGNAIRQKFIQNITFKLPTDTSE